MNREQWLQAAANRLRPLFEDAGAKIPRNTRIACGFPSYAARARKRTSLGECWSKTRSRDETYEILISPVLAEPVSVLDCLVHELVHAAVGVECGHRGPFRRVALAVGLSGPMTATVAGPKLASRLNALAKQLGPYPHAELDASKRGRRQGTRLRKVTCTDPNCGCVLRMTRTWLVTVGPPTCGCGAPMEACCEMEVGRVRSEETTVPGESPAPPPRRTSFSRDDLKGEEYGI
jgi:hypothetical protein